MSYLRFLADTYEQNQRMRIITGERIRAVLQHRDESFDAPDLARFTHRHPAKKATPEPGEKPICKRCDAILAAIGKEEHTGPVPILGLAYRRYWTAEREAFGLMEKGLQDHYRGPWSWLERVPGVGPTLACKLLSRLKIQEAEHVSSFWAYCGWGTVPAILFRCAVCGLEKAFPPTYDVTGRHQKLGGSARCKGLLEKIGEGRCAQPRPSAGKKAEYDQYAKKVGWLIGMQFVKIPGSPYERWYRHQRARLERERTGWAEGRQHLTALRKTIKLFLSHLWLVWREAEGLPVTEPYPQAQGHGGYVGPWEMVDGSERDERKKRKKS